jgi:hypothetical protein
MSEKVIAVTQFFARVAKGAVEINIAILNLRRGEKRAQ